MPEFRFSMPIQPRYADFDMLGHLNNATYMTYFEVARIHYFEDIGWNLDNVTNVVAHFDIDILLPVFPESSVICFTKTISLGRKSFRMQYELTSEDGSRCFSRAQSVQVCTDKNTGQALTMPDKVREMLSNYDGL